MKLYLFARPIAVLLVLVFLAAAPVQAGLEVLEAVAPAPHEKVVHVQVSVPSQATTGSWIFAKSLVKLFSLGFAKGPPRADHVKYLLRLRLKQVAFKYKADAVSEVRYYPDPNSPSFLRSKRYFARGALIQYRLFPEAPAPKK